MLLKLVLEIIIKKRRNGFLQVKDKINLFFCYRMTEYYNKEENKLKDIICNHVHSVNENHKVRLDVYYRNCNM